jgi:hypothetical protein
MRDPQVLILIAGNIPVYWLLGWLIFKTWGAFFECLKFWLTPEIFSAFNGEYWDDVWAETKLFLWLFACGACVFAEHMLLRRFQA